MMHLKKQIIIGLGYFLLAATLGLLLRSFVVFDLPIDYKYIVHTHSHIALLGWVYVTLTTYLYMFRGSRPFAPTSIRFLCWCSKFLNFKFALGIATVLKAATR